MTLFDLCKDKTLPIIVSNGKNYYRIRHFYSATFPGITYNHFIADLGSVTKKGYIRFLGGGWIIGEQEAKANKWFSVKYLSIAK